MQHDLDIANAAGATARGDINNAFQSLGSLNSGASAPSTTYANMWWADTTTNTLKRRNNANTAWMIIQSLDAALVEAVTAVTIGDDDCAKLFVVDTAASARTIAFDPVATLGNRFSCFIINDGTAGNGVTLDPDSSETINGGSTLTVVDGFVSFVWCDGTELFALNFPRENGVRKDANNTFTKAQRAAVTPLSVSGGSYTPGFNDSNDFSLTLSNGVAETLANPTGTITPGQKGCIYITQNGTGASTLAYGSYWKIPGGTAPVVSTTLGAVDRIDYAVETATRIHFALSLDVS